MVSQLALIQEVQGLNSYLHPTPFFYIQIYLFILLGFSHIHRANPDSRHRRIPPDRPTEPNQTKPNRPESESDQTRNLSGIESGIRPESKPKIRTRRAELFQKKLFRVVHPRNASKHFSYEHPFEQFKLDMLSTT